nr:MAG: hypothetical protein [Hemigrapsus takanoi nimavirus]
MENDRCHCFVSLLEEVNFEGVPEVEDGKKFLDIIRNSKVHDGNRYHEETLFKHLIGAAIHTHSYASDQGWCSDDDWLYFILGFMHDVGKLGAHRPIYKKSNRWSTRGHALNGAASLESWILNEAFRKTFNLSARDCEIITVATNYHMCVHSSFDDDSFERNAKLLGKCIDDQCAKALSALRYGDGMAKVPQVTVDSRDLLSSSSENVFRPDNLGLLINITGFSGCGKSTLSREIVDFLDDRYNLKEGKDVFWINRDTIVREVVGKEINPVIDNKRAVHEHYEANKTRLSPMVNQIIQNRIADVLVAAERVCILDTMALMNFNSRAQLLKSVPKNGPPVSIDVWTHRFPDSSYNEEESMQRMGISLQEQLAINSNNGNKRSAMDVFGSSISWAPLDSIMENGAAPNENSAKRSLYTMPVGHGKNLMRAHFFHLLTNLMDERSSLVSCSPPPLLGEEHDASLLTLVERLILGDSSLKRLERFFETHNYTTNFKKIRDDGVYLFCVKYIDRLNKIMLPLWAREARGAGFLIDASANRVLKIKQPLDRCVEIVTNQHAVKGVGKSQDMKNKDDVLFLNKEQREVVEVFNNKQFQKLKYGEWFLTEKVDGCLLVTSMYRHGTTEYEYLDEAIRNGKHVPWHVYKDGWLIIPATSGSLEVGKAMKSTLLTAVAGPEPSNEDWDRFWDTDIKHRFASMMLEFASSAPVTTVIMEMVCKQRKTYDNLNIHKEIATSYDYSGLFVLGLYGGGDDKYLPSYKIPQNMIEAAIKKGLMIPKTRVLNTPNDAFEAMLEIENAFRAMDEEFIRNTHPEGFIVTRHGVSGNGVAAACKLKLPIYYKAHSLHSILGKLFTNGKLFKKDNNKSLEDGRTMLTDNDLATFKYFSNFVTESSDKVLFRVFPDVERTYFVTGGRLAEAVSIFCHDALENCISRIVHGSVEKSLVDYNLFPSTIQDRMKRDKRDTVDYEICCRYLVAKCEQGWFKSTLVTVFRKHILTAAGDDEVFEEACSTMKANAPWLKKRRNLEDVVVRKRLVDMVL